MNYFNRKENTEANVRVEYECTPVRHLVIECPKCGNWFQQGDIVKGDWIQYSYQMGGAPCECPMCNFEFNLEPVEVAYGDIYEDVKRKKETWE